MDYLGNKTGVRTFPKVVRTLRSVTWLVASAVLLAGTASSIQAEGNNILGVGGLRCSELSDWFTSEQGRVRLNHYIAGAFTGLSLLESQTSPDNFRDLTFTGPADPMSPARLWEIAVAGCQENPSGLLAQAIWDRWMRIDERGSLR